MAAEPVRDGPPSLPAISNDQRALSSITGDPPPPPDGWRLLPLWWRARCSAAYEFAALVRTIADGAVPGEGGMLLEAKGRLRALDLLDADVDRIFSHRHPRHPTLRRLRRHARRHGLSAGPLRHLLEAGRQDQLTTRYARFDDLLGYCELSGASLGQLLLSLLGGAAPAQLEQVGGMLTASRLLDLCLDTGLAAQLGRVYLPRDDLEAFGVDERALTADRTSPALRSAVEALARRAQYLLAAAVPVVPTLRPVARIAISGLLAETYASSRRLEEVRFNVLEDRPRAVPSRRRRMRAFLDVLARPAQ